MPDTITADTPNAEFFSHLAQAVTLDNSEHAAELMHAASKEHMAFLREMLVRLTAIDMAEKLRRMAKDGDVIVLTVAELLDMIESSDAD